jgi:phosphatidylglycerol:prolipoprotein diacylglycerol transferase
MLQTLFYIPAQVAGYPLFGFGLLLAVWAVASVGVLAYLAWRQGFNADTLGYVPILLLMGAIIYWVLPAISEPRGLPIHGYGVMMLLAVVAATLLAAWRARRVGLDPELIFSLAFWMLVPGIIGARAFYVIEYWPDYWPYYTRPDGGLGSLVGHVVNIAEGGLVVYGAFFGGVAGMLLFIRKHRLSLLALCDLIAPSMMLGLAIGRVGCLMNGCCYGAVCDHPWAITFPANTPPDYTPPYRAQVDRGQMYGFTLSSNPETKPRIRAVDPNSSAGRAGLRRGDLLQNINGLKLSTTGLAYAALEEAFFKRQPLEIQIADRPTITVPAIALPKRSLPVHPTQIYSTIDALLLCLLLLAYDPFRRRDGEMFALMMSIYPVTRFLIESLRSDEAAVAGTGMSISQNVSLLLLVCAAALWFYLRRQPRGLAFPAAGRQVTH